MEIKQTDEFAKKNDKHIGGECCVAEQGWQKTTGELRRCPVCGEAIETYIDFPAFDGSKQIVRKKFGIMCRCEREKEKRAQENKMRQAEMKAIQDLKSFSLMEEKHANATLRSFVTQNGNEQLLKIITKYINRFDEMYERNQGLLFWGGVGTGKSYAAAVIANELMNRKVPVLMTSFAKILKESWSTSYDGTSKFNRVKLLIIDDLGVERSTEYALEKMYDVIDGRYQSKKPIIITTNLTIDQMKKETDIKYVRVYDRIFEMCYPVRVEGMSWRKKEAVARFKSTKAFFEEG